MSYEISATTKLEPQLNQVLVTDFLMLKSRLEQVESKEEILRQKKAEKEVYETKSKIKILKIIGFSILFFFGTSMAAMLIEGLAKKDILILDIIAFVSPVVLSIALARRNNRKYLAMAKEAENIILQTADHVSAERNSISSEYNYIPPNMLFSYAIGKLIQIVQYNRADNWMAALNLLEQEIRMDRMEVTQALQNQAMMQEIQAAKDAASAAAITSGASFIGGLFK